MPIILSVLAGNILKNLHTYTHFKPKFWLYLKYSDYLLIAVLRTEVYKTKQVASLFIQVK